MPDFVANFSDSKVWDDFIARHAGPDGGLLQSWAWGEVQREYQRPVRRMVLLNGERVVLAWQVVSHRLPLGWSYWYVPRPIANPPAGRAGCELRITDFEFFIEQIVKLAKRERVMFLRIDDGERAVFEKFGFRKVSGSVQPQEELIVDAQRPEPELLSAMKPKTRYNIRIAEKHGVTVASLPPDEISFKKFWPLLCATAKRQKIRTHAESYYRAMFRTFAQSGSGHLLVAESSGRPLASALVVSFNGVLTYLHGGSSGESSELMAPYLLHWHAMRLTRQQGLRAYNFGGVSTVNPGWAGISRFKQGFAPVTPFTSYGGLWECPVEPGAYQLYRWAKKYDIGCRICM